MIDHLQDMLPRLEQLPPEAQEKVAAYIEALTKDFLRQHSPRILRETAPAEQWVDLVGAWSDLPDSILEDLDQLRHEQLATPPIDSL